MLEISSEQYEALKKNADDNQAVKSVAKFFIFMVFMLVVFFTFMGTYGCHAANMQKKLDEASINKQAREIESEGLEYEQYIEWLEARNGGRND